MKVRLLLVPVFLVTAVVTFAAGKQLTDKLFASILKYYADCAYVAANSTPAEIFRIVNMLQRAQKPPLGLLDFKKKRLYAAIAATQGVVLEPDPGILALRIPAIQYFFKVTPVEIVSAGTQSVSIRVKRESAWPIARFAQPAGPESPPQNNSGQFAPLWPYGTTNSRSDVRVTTEIDEWVMVDGTWRLQPLHYYLL